MVFTLEQNKFITMSYYRNGVKRDGERTFSVQACKEEFLANYPGQNILEKFLAAHTHRIVDRFVTTGSVEKWKSSGRPKVIEDVENRRDHLEEHPRTSLTRLSLQTGVPPSTCHKIVKKNVHLHPYKVTRAPP
ncbi:hypothetical protein MTP99_013602 [Tenebrio molitor]|nr:hypothetical protein MTP99_013602 [Tenebrio molitor]